ncbi:hypothetical protein [Rhizobium ruizarguesonis]
MSGYVAVSGDIVDMPKGESVTIRSNEDGALTAMSPILIGVRRMLEATVHC